MLAWNYFECPFLQTVEKFFYPEQSLLRFSSFLPLFLFFYLFATFRAPSRKLFPLSQNDLLNYPDSSI